MRGTRWALLLLLVAAGLGGGMAARSLMGGRRTVEPGAPQPELSRQASTVWARLLTAFNSRVAVLRREIQRFAANEAGAPTEPGSQPAPRREAEFRPRSLPDDSGASPEQRAANLWQGGTLATRHGDYAWAIRQFKSCLEADPGSEGCKTGLAEAQRRLKWNNWKGRREEPRAVPGP